MHPSYQASLIQSIYIDESEVITNHNEAYCIEKQWWESWKSYVGFDGEASGEEPKEIPNGKLLEEGKYVPEIESLSVLVIFEIWKRLQEWYGGGPEIVVYIVDKRPDFSPITIHTSESDQLIHSYNFFVSTRMTVAHLEKVICKKFMMVQKKIILNLVENDATINISTNSNLTLKQVKINDNSHLMIEQNEHARTILHNLMENIEEEEDDDGDYNRNYGDWNDKHVEVAWGDFNVFRNNTQEVRDLVTEIMPKFNLKIHNWSNTSDVYQQMIGELKSRLYTE